MRVFLTALPLLWSDHWPFTERKTSKGWQIFLIILTISESEGRTPQPDGQCRLPCEPAQTGNFRLPNILRSAQNLSRFLGAHLILSHGWVIKGFKSHHVCCHHVVLTTLVTMWIFCLFHVLENAVNLIVCLGLNGNIKLSRSFQMATQLQTKSRNLQ